MSRELERCTTFTYPHLGAENLMLVQTQKSFLQKTAMAP